MKKLLICLLIFVGAIFISCNFVINATTTKTVPEQPMIQTEPLSLIVEIPAPSTDILPEEEPAPTPEQEPLATREEIELLALCTMAEAEGECEQGQRLVIDSVLNRVDNPHFPDTISEVIWQKNQYAGMYGDRITRCYVMDELVKLVEEELENRTDYDVVFFNAGHYSDYGVPMFQVGNHYFSSYAEPGMYGNIALLDIASMHPSSIIAEDLFGPVYTKRFREIRDARVAIKHKEFDKARKMLNGALAKYLTDESAADALAQALKIAINSVYGLTSASFENPFHDNRNKDNIVAKRGALFMINLKHEVQKRGFVVAHIKTDSIKIPDATPEIIQFVMDYGKMYGYIFEHEATYDRMCLVNNAVYIAKYKDGKHAGEWTATGTQFQIPYVFKKLFSHEEITFEDMCETKSVTGALYLDMNESLPDVSALEDEYAKLWKKISDTTKLNEPMEAECARIEELTTEIEKGHDYVFIGRVGQFCPIKPGCGGGLLCRESVDKKTGEKKYDAAVGTKGYRWLESEMVKELGKEDCIDRRYHKPTVEDILPIMDRIITADKVINKIREEEG